MKDEVIVKVMPKEQVVYIYANEAYDECTVYIKKMVKVAWRKICGPIKYFYLSNKRKNINEMELCFPVKEMGESNGVVAFKEIPQMEYVTTFYKGKYQNISEAYERIRAYALENKIELDDTNSREDFIKGPGRFFVKFPRKIKVEVMIPINKAEKKQD